MACKTINTELNKVIGSKLLRVRHRAGISQQNVADELNFSSTTYSKLENGKVDFTVTRLNELAHYFKVNISDFLDSNIETPRMLKDLRSPSDYKTLEAKYELLRELYDMQNK
ncbi:MAG: helix-turn-helix transcriptional regulator [Bacteroidales bacterium]|nr:helix-turn-helix transcriptional regulator [Bacteroidales bacterium]